MKRRDFIKYSCLGITASFIPRGIFALRKNSSLNENIIKPIEMKLNVKPVHAGRIHVDAYGGPCRWHPIARITPEAETEYFHESGKRFFKTVRENLSKDANILKPESVVLHRDWREYEKGDIIKQKSWAKIEKDVSDVDLFLISARIHGLEKYKKPVAWVGNRSWNLDWSSFLRNEGIEGYALYDWDELNELVSFMRVRKAVRKTKVLSVTDRPDSPPVCLLAEIKPDDMEQKFGVDYQFASYKEFFNEMDRISQDRTEQEKAEEIVNRLLKNAGEVFMKKKYVLNDVNFYLTAKSMMNRYNCNAFIIRCFELCGSHIAADRKITPCLANILLRDEGLPSACEGDLNALFTAMIMMYLSRKPVYMGNVHYNAENNTLRVYHDAATLKMKGLQEPDLPYEIQPFTHETSGAFGTTIRYDFSLDKGQPVTVTRFDPVRRKAMLTKGKIVGGRGFRDYGCTLGVHIEIPDVKEFYHKGADIGSHLIVVYGDHTDEVKKLGEIMNYEVL